MESPRKPHMPVCVCVCVCVWLIYIYKGHIKLINSDIYTVKGFNFKSEY